MKIVVGLGNPGKRYENTPHNAGFAVVDSLAAALGCRLRLSLRLNARVGKAFREGAWVWFAKPQTYMNRSGAAVSALLRYRKATVADLVVVVDDADLPLGRIRIRQKGGAGGHRGLESILQHVHSREFVRVRVGVGRDRHGKDLVDHVLSPFSAGERRQMSRVVEEAAGAVGYVLDSRVEAAMNLFNGMTVEAEAEKS